MFACIAILQVVLQLFLGIIEHFNGCPFVLLLLFYLPLRFQVEGMLKIDNILDFGRDL